MFNMTLSIMASGRFNILPSVMEMLLLSAVDLATNTYLVSIIQNWLNFKQITNDKYVLIDGCEINLKVKYAIIRKIFATVPIPEYAYNDYFEDLAQAGDPPEMIDLTRKFCDAATVDPERKKIAFLKIFEKTNEMSLKQVEEMCQAFQQYQQRDMIQDFSDEFFNRIEDCVNTKSWSLTRSIYKYLAPGMKATDEDL